MVYTFPAKFNEIEHTADAGISVKCQGQEECIAQMCLGLSAMLLGENMALKSDKAHSFSIYGPAPMEELLVNLLREIFLHFNIKKELPISVELKELSEQNIKISCTMLAFDQDAYGQGLDIKAVTYHQAKFERSGKAFFAQVIFDI